LPQQPAGVEMSEKIIISEEKNDDLPQVVNLTSCFTESIEAELTRLHQSAAREVTSEEVELHQSIALDVTTASLTAHEAGIGLVNTSDAQLTNSAAGAIRAGNITLAGQAGVVVADSANLGNTYAGVVAGSEIRGERIETIILLGNHVEGDIHTVVDTRGALLGGITGGLVAGCILLIGRILFRGRK